MNIKTLSRLCGILFITTVLAFFIGNMILKMPLVDSENYANTFQLVRDSAVQYRAGNFIAFMGLVAQFALVITLYQILRPVNPFYALLALGWRMGEQVLLTIGIIAGFLILGLSQTVPLPPGNGIPELDYLGQILVSAPVHGEDIAFVFLGVGSVINNTLFYKSKAIPPLLALLGVIGAVLYALAPALSMIVDLPEAIRVIVLLPMILFELIIGVYLIFWPLKQELGETA
jgi:hypothetical protein